MNLQRQLEWARSEWGIFSRTATMGDRIRWLRQWVPFGARTIGFGTISILLGPITPGRRASTWAARAWSRTSTKSLRIDAQIEGVEHVPRSGGFVYATNHQSLLDILVLGGMLPGDFKWAAKRSLMNIPFLGWHLRLAGHVPVDRRRDKNTAQAVALAFESVLRRGKPLLIFPEGTRSMDGQIKPFKKGGFHAAVRTGCPVVPVALEGTFDIMNREALDTGDLQQPERRRVCIRIGPPIPPSTDGDTEHQVGALRDLTRQAVVAMHEQLRARAEER